MARGGSSRRFSFLADKEDKAGAAGVLASADTKRYRKGKEYVPRAPQTPQLHQQLAAQTAELEAFRASRAALKARLSAAEATVVAQSSAASTATAELINMKDQLHNAEQASLTQQTAREAAETAAEHLAGQLLAATLHSRAQQASLLEIQRQLSATSEQCAAFEGQLQALQHELANERKAHALTNEREVQATAALQLAQQQHNRCAAALAASQQQLSFTAAENDLLRCQLLSAERSVHQLQVAHAANMAHLRQQLTDSTAARQQQREAAARARADAQAAGFNAACLTAQVKSLRSQVAESRQQLEAARAAAETTHASLQLVHHQRDAAVSCCQSLRQQQAAAVIMLAATWQQLQAARADLSAASNKLAAGHKAADKLQQQSSSTISALQHKLDSSTKHLQQLREGAAKALVAAAAQRFVTARLQAQKNSLANKVSVVSAEKDAAIKQLQKAEVGRAATEQALHIETQQHTSTAAQLAESQQQLDSSHASAALLQQQLSTTQYTLAKLQHTSAQAVEKLQQQVATQQQHKQQQREAAARFAAEAGALRFAAARLTASNRTLQAWLDVTAAADKQLSPSSAAADVATPMHAPTQAEVADSEAAQQQQLAKATACLAEAQQQLVRTAEQQQLHACRAAYKSTSSSTHSHARKTSTAANTAALHQQTHMQQQQQSTARAYARARAAEWKAAKQAAQYRSLQQQHMAAEAAAAATISSMQLRLQELSRHQHVVAVPEPKQQYWHLVMEAADVTAVLDCSDVRSTSGCRAGTHIAATTAAASCETVYTQLQGALAGHANPVGVLASVECSHSSPAPCHGGKVCPNPSTAGAASMSVDQNACSQSSNGPAASSQLQQGRQWGSGLAECEGLLRLQ